MQTCPHCGHDTFVVGRAIRVWQTLEMCVDALGGYDVGEDKLHETLDEEAFEEAECADCRRPVPLSHLFPTETPTSGVPPRLGPPRRPQGDVVGR